MENEITGTFIAVMEFNRWMFVNSSIYSCLFVGIVQYTALYTVIILSDKYRWSLPATVPPRVGVGHRLWFIRNACLQEVGNVIGLTK